MQTKDIRWVEQILLRLNNERYSFGRFNVKIRYPVPPSSSLALILTPLYLFALLAHTSQHH